MKFGTVVDKTRLPEANKRNKARNQHNRTNNEGRQVKRRRIEKYLQPILITQEVTPQPQEVTPQKPQEVIPPQKPQEVIRQEPMQQQPWRSMQNEANKIPHHDLMNGR